MSIKKESHPSGGSLFCLRSAKRGTKPPVIACNDIAGILLFHRQHARFSPTDPGVSIRVLILFCGIHGRNEHSTNRTAIMYERRQQIRACELRLLHKLQPIFRFVALFQSNLQLGNKIRSAVRVARFPYICPDRCRRSLQLIDKRMMPFDLFTQLQYFYGKIH